MPNGHDAVGGMGRSPKARRRIAPTRTGQTIPLAFFHLRSRPRALA